MKTGGRVAASVGWALVPLVTLGAGTPFSIGYAAVRRRSPWLFASAAGYAVSLALFLVQIALYDPITAAPGWLDAATSIGLLLNWLGGTAQSLAIRASVFAARPLPSANERAVELANQRRELRRQARALAVRDPGLAAELRIGRPDLPRQYDDGGLVDVNHAGPEALAAIPGLTPDLVRRIVEARAAGARFISADELSVTLDLPVDLSDELAEYSVYLP